DASGNHTLWETNGTPAGTHEITGISGAFTGNVGPFNQPGGLNPSGVATVDPTGTAAAVGVSADAFHFASTLGNGTNATTDMHSDPVGANAQATDLAALMTDLHHGFADTVMAYDGHETTHLDQVAQSHLHASIVHLV